MTSIFCPGEFSAPGRYMGKETLSGYLILEDGREFSGRFHKSTSQTAMTETSPSIGEVVFNTAMTGYQEVLYDPSYQGQIVVMTMPHIGNTGVNVDDEESERIYPTAFAARSFEQPSNFRSIEPLGNLLMRSGVPMFENLDTRAVTRHLREKGSLRGGFFPGTISRDDAMSMVLGHPSMEGLNCALEVTCDSPYDWNAGTIPGWLGNSESISDGKRNKVAVIDFGVKRNILRRLVDVGCDVRVFPYTIDVSIIDAYEPDGILLSNGPGDPAAVTGATEAIRHFLGRLPIFGICLGHQLLALACGGHTYKMKFGHRGINHPVGESAEGRVQVSVHNHGFAVSDDPLPDGAVLTLRSLNDGTVEGLEYPGLSAFSVQFHPEASPGPHDSSDLFLKFRKMMDGNARKN
jgi:carbamoyl-phosphate synthase small subunit